MLIFNSFHMQQVSERLTDLISDSNQMVTMVQCVNSILLASELSPDVSKAFDKVDQIVLRSRQEKIFT